jgi:hypothetical protein
VTSDIHCATVVVYNTLTNVCPLARTDVQTLLVRLGLPYFASFIRDYRFLIADPASAPILALQLGGGLAGHGRDGPTLPLVEAHVLLAVQCTQPW